MRLDDLALESHDTLAFGQVLASLHATHVVVAGGIAIVNPLAHFVEVCQGFSDIPLPRRQVDFFSVQEVDVRVSRNVNVRCDGMM